MPDCTGHWHEEEIANVHEEFIPSPFDAQELKSDPSIPHGPTTLYLLDVSGKLITIYQGVLEEAGDRQLASLGIPLSTLITELVCRRSQRFVLRGGYTVCLLE